MPQQNLHRTTDLPLYLHTTRESAANNARAGHSRSIHTVFQSITLEKRMGEVTGVPSRTLVSEVVYNLKRFNLFVWR